MSDVVGGGLNHRAVRRLWLIGGTFCLVVAVLAYLRVFGIWGEGFNPDMLLTAIPLTFLGAGLLFGALKSRQTDRS